MDDQVSKLIDLLNEDSNQKIKQLLGEVLEDNGISHLREKLLGVDADTTSEESLSAEELLLNDESCSRDSSLSSASRPSRVQRRSGHRRRKLKGVEPPYEEFERKRQNSIASDTALFEEELLLDDSWDLIQKLENAEKTQTKWGNNSWSHGPRRRRTGRRSSATGNETSVIDDMLADPSNSERKREEKATPRGRASATGKDTSVTDGGQEEVSKEGEGRNMEKTASRGRSSDDPRERRENSRHRVRRSHSRKARPRMRARTPSRKASEHGSSNRRSPSPQPTKTLSTRSRKTRSAEDLIGLRNDANQENSGYAAIQAKLGGSLHEYHPTRSELMRRQRGMNNSFSLRANESWTARATTVYPSRTAGRRRRRKSREPPINLGSDISDGEEEAANESHHSEADITVPDNTGPSPSQQIECLQFQPQSDRLVRTSHHESIKVEQLLSELKTTSQRKLVIEDILTPETDPKSKPKMSKKVKAAIGAFLRGQRSSYLSQSDSDSDEGSFA